MANRSRTRAIRARNARVVRDGAGICHLCGHPGADAADHVVPLAQGGSDTVDNLRPAHHFEPCPTCGVKCNRVKGDKVIAPVIRRSGALARPQGGFPSPPVPAPSRRSADLSTTFF